MSKLVKLLPVVLWVADRLREPSTWAGAAALFPVLGISAGAGVHLIASVSGICGVIAMVLKEVGVQEPPVPPVA
jgi:hypothetical protein